MAVLNTLLSTVSTLAGVAERVKPPKAPWEYLILNVFDFIKDYGWRIVVFIVLLKLLLLPLDIFQRYKMRKNTKIAEMLKPQMDKLKAQYAGDPRGLQSKQMELNKRSGYSYFSSCIPMLLTLFIFISLFSGMRNISRYMIFRQYADWYDTYNMAISEYETINADYKAQKEGILVEIARYDGLLDALDESDPANIETARAYREEIQKYEAEFALLTAVAESYAQGVVEKYNEDNANSFYWIKSLWQPDVLWVKPIHKDKAAFEKSVGSYASLTKDKGGIGEVELSEMLNQYDKVTYRLVNSEDNKQNGLMVLVIASFLLSVGSQLITQKLQKKSGQLDSAAMGGSTMKVMMFAMPAIMAVVAIQYTAAFALYMVANSAMTILINMSTTLVMNLMDKKQKVQSENAVIQYGRPDPNAVQPKKNKK